MSIESLKQQARKHERNEDWQKALNQYNKALAELAREEQVDIGLHNRVGDLYVRVGNLDPAVEHYEKAVELYREAYLPNNAIAVCKKVIRNVPERHKAYLTIGQIRAEQGFIPDARTNFLTYAERMQQDGDLDESFRALIEFCDLALDDVAVRITVAEQMVAQGMGDEAVEQLLIVHRHYGQLGETAQAEDLATRILTINPEADLDALPAMAGSFGGSDGEISSDFGEISFGGDGFGGGSDASVGLEDAAEEESDESSTGGDEIEIETEGDFGEILIGGDSANDEAEDEGEAVDLPMMDMGDDEGTATPLPLMGFDEDDTKDSTPLPTLDFTESGDDESADLPMIEIDSGAVETVETEAFDIGAAVVGDQEVEVSIDFSTLEAPADDAADFVEEPAELAKGAEELSDAFEDTGDSPLDVVHEAEDDSDALTLDEFALDATPASNDEPVDFAASERDEVAPMEAEPAELTVDAVSGAIEDAVEDAVSDLAEAEETPAPPAPRRPPAPEPDGGFVDFGAMILGTTKEKSTRFTVAYEEPSGDEEADFAKMLSQFKAKVSENLDSSDVRAHYDLGTAYKEMGLLDEAISSFQAALRASADHLPTYEVMGQTFLEMGQPEAAVKSLERAIESADTVEDELVGIYYYLGRAYEELQNSPSALECYDRVFSLDINFADVTERLRALR
jgi:tetratricopeptide (TPR) repeat protein